MGLSRFWSKVRRVEYGLTVVLRLGLGCMFIWASLPKIRQPFDFLSNVYDYEMVGPKMGMLVAMVLPWLELLLGICLVGGIFLSGALLMGTGLMVIFTYGHASVLSRGLLISCGCFSASSPELIGYATLIRSCLILSAFLWVLAWEFILRQYRASGVPI